MSTTKKTPKAVAAAAAETPPTSRRKLLKGETPPSTEAASMAAAKTTAAAKTKKEKKPKKQAAEMVKVERYIVEHWETCRAIAAEIEALQAEYNGLRETAKEIKEAAAGKSAILRRMNSRGPERLPLFDEPPKPTTEAAPSTPTAAAPGTIPEAAADAWRAAPLRESLHKPGKTALNKSLDVLTKKGIDTIGKLEDLRASGGGYRKWQDAAKGIGDEGAEAVTDAVLAWLTKHRDAAVFAAAAPQKAADAKPSTEADAGPTLPPASVPPLPRDPSKRKPKAAAK